MQFSLTGALTTVKALLKALGIHYHNKQFVYFYCQHGKKKIFPNKPQQEQKKRLKTCIKKNV